MRCESQGQIRITKCMHANKLCYRIRFDEDLKKEFVNGKVSFFVFNEYLIFIDPKLDLDRKLRSYNIVKEKTSFGTIWITVNSMPELERFLGTYNEVWDSPIRGMDGWFYIKCDEPENILCMVDLVNEMKGTTL